MSDEIEIVPTEVADAPPAGLPVRVVDARSPAVFGTSKPSEIIEKATEVARLLAPIVVANGLYKDIPRKNQAPKRYVFCEGWTTMIAMLGVFPKLEWSRRVQHESACIYEARVQLIDGRTGMVICAGESMCSSLEEKWEDRDEYAIRSMAETRATAKACRLGFSWIMVLAGCAATPAEEMQDDADPDIDRPKCPMCGKAMFIFDDAYSCWKKRGGCGHRIRKGEDVQPSPPTPPAAPAPPVQPDRPVFKPAKGARVKGEVRGAAGGPLPTQPAPVIPPPRWDPPDEWVEYIGTLVGLGIANKVPGVSSKVTERLNQPEHRNQTDWWEMTKYLWGKFRADGLEVSVEIPACVVTVGMDELGEGR